MTRSEQTPKRPIKGTLSIDAIPGTILGPTDITREYLVVLDCVDGVSTLGYAQQVEIDASLRRDPQSTTEVRMRQR